MQNLKSRIEKVLLVLVAILIVAFITFRSKPNNQDQNDSVPKGASFKSLVPGDSTKSDTIERLGDPLNNKESNSLDFKSRNPNLPHQVLTENEKITFIKEIITAEDGKTSTYITNFYGEAPYVLYGLESIHGFNLYIYPDKGIAYIGHVKEPILLEVWYFQPTTQEDFRDKWAPNYSGTFQPRQ